jgi:hypothetical protein
MDEPLTNFAKGALLIIFGVLLGWFGVDVRNQSCGFFGSSVLCGAGSIAILATIVIILIGAVYAGISLIDFFRDRR